MGADDGTIPSGLTYDEPATSTHGINASPQQGGLREGPNGYNEDSSPSNADEFAVEDISNQDPSSEIGVEVLYPYQYEEPDPESSSRPVTWPAPKRLEYDEISSSSLVDSIESLHCYSGQESKPRRRRTRHRAGTKRKPSGPLDRKVLVQSTDFDDEMEDWNNEQYVRPRKVRRRNRDGQDASTTLSDSMSELTSHGYGSSSTMATSGETSAEESSSPVSRGDPMDIDQQASRI